VEVVGTEFDVLNRSNNKRVILQEGKVRLRLETTPHTNTPLSEIARMLEDNYGYQVEFSSAVDQAQTRSSLGVIDIQSMDALIAVVEASYEVSSITKKEKIIEIK